MAKLANRLDMLMPDWEIHNVILAASIENTYTILVDDYPAAIVGANVMWEGVAQVWAISSDLIRGHGLAYTKIVDELFKWTAVKNKIRRYHAIVQGNNIENIRWLYMLGFTYEFCMYKAAPDKSDVLGYVRWEKSNVIWTQQTKTRLQESVEQLFRMAA